MSEDEETKRRGRPPTGITEKRQVRIGDEWDLAEQIALDLARLDGKVRQVRNRVTRELEEKGDIAGYIEEAIREKNARTLRLIAKRRAEADAPQ